MNKDNKIQIGSEVTMHFTIKLTDNTVAETTTKGEPSKFVVTEESLNDPVESKLIGLKAGDKTRIELTPEQGYGYPNPENYYEFPRSQFPKDLEPKEGDIYSFDRPSGESVPGLLCKIDDEKIMVDFNHPLSGKTLLFEVTIVDVSMAE